MALPTCQSCEREVRTVYFTDDGRSLCKFCLDEWKMRDWKKDVASHVKRDKYPTPLTLENYGPHPITFNSESERIAHMKQAGLEHRERWIPFPGTDRDPMGVQNSNNYKDPVTIRNAQELMLRAAGVKQEAEGNLDKLIRFHRKGHEYAMVIQNILASQLARERSHFHDYAMREHHA